MSREGVLDAAIKALPGMLPWLALAAAEEFVVEPVVSQRVLVVGAIVSLIVGTLVRLLKGEVSE